MAKRSSARTAGRGAPAQLAFKLEAVLVNGNVLFVLHDEPLALQHARTAIHQRLITAAAQ
jgi:hypothetical protein